MQMLSHDRIIFHITPRNLYLENFRIDFANLLQDRHQKPAQVMVFVNVPMMILLAKGDLSCPTQGLTDPYTDSKASPFSFKLPFQPSIARK